MPKVSPIAPLRTTTDAGQATSEVTGRNDDTGAGGYSPSRSQDGISEDANPRHVERDVDGKDKPDGSVIETAAAATWHGRVSWLPVIEQRGEWLHVRLAPRPHGSAAWTRRDYVTLATTPYRGTPFIIVDSGATSA